MHVGLFVYFWLQGVLGQSFICQYLYWVWKSHKLCWTIMPFICLPMHAFCASINLSWEHVVDSDTEAENTISILFWF